MKVSIEFDLMPFSTPNFVRTKKGEDEILSDSAIKLSDLSENDLNDLCDQFRADIMSKAGYGE